MDKETKTFTRWNGEVELTRDEYVKEWTDTTHQYVYMFAKHGLPSVLMNFQLDVMRMAGKEWDNK